MTARFHKREGCRNTAKCIAQPLRLNKDDVSFINQVCLMIQLVYTEWGDDNEGIRGHGNDPVVYQDIGKRRKGIIEFYRVMLMGSDGGLGAPFAVSRIKRRIRREK